MFYFFIQVLAMTSDLVVIGVMAVGLAIAIACDARAYVVIPSAAVIAGVGKAVLIGQMHPYLGFASFVLPAVLAGVIQAILLYLLLRGVYILIRRRPEY